MPSVHLLSASRLTTLFNVFQLFLNTQTEEGVSVSGTTVCHKPVLIQQMYSSQIKLPEHKREHRIRAPGDKSMMNGKQNQFLCRVQPLSVLSASVSYHFQPLTLP